MNGIMFKVDKRTELMSIILALSECNEYAEEHFNLSINESYRERVKVWFSKFKNHNCIKIAKQLGMVEEGFAYDNPILLAFQLSENLTYDGKISKQLIEELDCELLLKDFLYEVVNFAKETNFELFFKSEVEYYTKKLNELKKFFNDGEFLNLIKIYFKMEINSTFCVNIIPTLINSNHGFKIDDYIYANIGLPCEDFVNIEQFNKGYEHIIIHEFLHNFVNSNTEKYHNEINVFSNINNVQMYNKIGHVNDTIVRALTIRIRELMSGINASDFIKREHSWGFVYVEKVYKKIIEFERQNLNWNDWFENFIEIFIY